MFVSLKHVSFTLVLNIELGQRKYRSFVFLKFLNPSFSLNMAVINSLCTNRQSLGQIKATTTTGRVSEVVQYFSLHHLSDFSFIGFYFSFCLSLLCCQLWLINICLGSNLYLGSYTPGVRHDCPEQD